MSKIKTQNKQRYRPASEFDEVTLASKREYWRTRKREQRAKQSLNKKLSTSPNTGICKPVFTASSQTNKHVPALPHSLLSSTMLGGAGSFQNDVTQNKTNSYHLTPEIYFQTQINQKGTWHEKNKLNRIVPPCPESSSNARKCMGNKKKDTKSLTSQELNIGASMAKHNGASCAKGLPVSTACIKVHPNITETQGMQNRMSTINSTLLDVSQQRNVARFTPVYKKVKNLQTNHCLQPRSSTFIEHKVNKDILILGERAANRKAYTYKSECSTAQHRTTDVVPMTEEEKAAKKREIWRIKKREQRAKQAEKLKKDKERTQCFEKGQQETGKLSCALPLVNTMALREAKPKYVQPAEIVPSNRKAVPVTVKMRNDILSPPHRQNPLKYNSTNIYGAQGSMAKNQYSVSANRTNHLQASKPNNLFATSGGSLQFSGVTQTTSQYKIQQQKMLNTLKRKRLPQHLTQQNERVETAEEQHAKRREYWRIKKRLQRARLSLEVKARLKEWDTLKRCAVRFQRNLEQMRKTQAVFRRVPQMNKVMLTNDSGPIGGFIKEDGTVSLLKTSAEICPPGPSRNLNAVNSTYPAVPSTSPSQNLVSLRNRSAVHETPKHTNSSLNIHERSSDQNFSAVDPSIKSKLTNNKADPDVLEGMTEEMSHDTVKTEPKIESVYSITGQSHSEDLKNVKSVPSPPPEAKVEKEAASVCDSQATTLLVVASMKKLLEDSLSSMTDTCTSTTNQDALMPIKSEDHCPPQETEANIEPDLATDHGAVDCKFSVYTNPSIEVKLSPSLCHSPTQTPVFSAEDTLLSCQGSSIQLPPIITTGNSGYSLGPKDRTHDHSLTVGETTVQSNTQGYGGKTAGPQQCCPPSACVGHQLNEHSKLQKKREYWRITKRRQRANKAEEKERSKYAVPNKLLSQPLQSKCNSSQVHRQPVAKPVCQTNLDNHMVLPAMPLHPTRLVLSPTASNQQSCQQSSNGRKAKFSETSQVKKRQLQACAPTSSTRPETVTSTPMSHVKHPGPQMQIKRHYMTNLKNNLSHLKAAAKQGIDPEEVLKRKRLQWRIKKQEQRAKKAARERQLSYQDNLIHTELNCSTITAIVESTPPERLDYIPEQCQSTSYKDEAELCFVSADDCSDELLSEAKWRSIYLMDYEPVNQLLVCMVCGEQQYCLSVEGVKAHIEEAHPGTLSLGETERQSILQAWDEQVAVRERFFSTQLWQHNGPPKEESMTHTAEVEVILDADTMKQTHS
ncbi:uncharacterized protein si:dkey-28a3.2 [Hoplias malabaricus]|uniref:uncharacterized protein si:dkey-28a3.2 n=1 Tax=Hoplias malabaricus TaxID=27720 RepID=UPI0034625A09